MTAASRRVRWIAAPLLFAAVAASSPIVRWCPIAWPCVPLDVLLRCALAPELLAPAIPSRDSQARHAQEASPFVCGASVAPWACGAPPASACDGTGSCPHRAATRPPAGPPSPGANAPVHGRAFRLDAPALASGAHETGPTLDPPRASAMPVALALALAPPDAPPLRRPAPLEPRPPTRDADARPPVRGPPLRG